MPATKLNGYGNLSELITLGRMRCEKGAYRLTRADFDGTPQPASDTRPAAGSIDHLAGMPDCIVLWIPARHASDEVLEADGRWVASTFPPEPRTDSRAYLALRRTHRMDDDLVIKRMRLLGQALSMPCVATGNVHMHVRSRKPLQDTLTAIPLGATRTFDEFHTDRRGRLSNFVALAVAPLESRCRDYSLSADTSRA